MDWRELRLSPARLLDGSPERLAVRRADGMLVG